MIQRSILVVLLALGGAFGLVAGCGPVRVSAENPIAISAGEYDSVFEASIGVLRDNGFHVDRKDRRFGVVATHPSSASSYLEPWGRDNTTSALAWENTLNHQRRTVKVYLEPEQAPEAEPAPESAAAPAPADPVEAAAPVTSERYLMRVEVLLERKVLPAHALTTAAFGGVGMRTPNAMHRRPLTTERGQESLYWRPVGRDDLLEQRLVAAILSRAIPAQGK